MKNYLWIALCCLCFSAAAGPVKVIEGAIHRNTHWTAGSAYVLQGIVVISPGVTLTLDPGTIVLGDKNSKGTLLIARGARLVAEGTPQEPIVFTSSEDRPAPGDWGGVVILGQAGVQSTYAGVQGLGRLQALGGISVDQTLYGGGELPNGPVEQDNSGILRYVRIEYAGADFFTGERLAGLTLAGVGSGTTLSHIQVSNAANDGFKWLGGTVQVRHLVSYACGDEDFECDNGYRGLGQFLLAVRNPLLADASGSSTIEIKNSSNSTTLAPSTEPIFSNVTVLGPTGRISNNYKSGVHFRLNGRGGIYNSVLAGRFPVGVLIDGQGTVDQANGGRLNVANSFLSGPTLALQAVPEAWDIRAWYIAPARFNNVTADSNGVRLANPFNLRAPNPLPNWNSPVLRAASFSDTRLRPAFFSTVAYAGAFGSQNWTCPWARFPDLSANSCLTATHTVDRSDMDIKINPTTADQQTTLRLAWSGNEKGMIRVFNMEGQLVWQEAVSAANEVHLITTSQWPGGIYVVQIQLQHGSMAWARFVVAH
jgi:hypothetical protein